MSVSQGSDKTDHHARMHAQFRWAVPAQFNIAQACCTRWARGADGAARIAVRAHGAGREGGLLTFASLQAQADRLSNVLVSLGVRRGDRVAIVMPQRFETAIAYMAVFQMGAVAMPLSMLFGPEALAYRLQDSEAGVAICDESSIGSLLAVRDDCPSLRTLVGVGAAALRADLDWGVELARHPASFTAARTKADEGAVLIYTSGTTGPPKGALIPHRALIGNLPGFVCSQNWFGFPPGAVALTDPSPVRERAGERTGQDVARPPGADQNSAVFWSPADWAWTGGLMDALLPSLYFGRPIVAHQGRFSPELAFALMQEHGVTHTFLFPTALKAMMKAFPQPRRQFRLKLQAIMSAGEAVGDAVFAYCRDELGVVVNEMFGQTEINYVVGNCSMEWGAPSAARGPAPVDGAQPGPGRPAAGVAVSRDAVGWPARPGSMGRPYPGHRVAVIDEDGHECPVGVPGDVAVNRFDVHGDPDPIFFLGYWRNEAATQRKFTGDWCRTGDLAVRDADGYLWYQGRADDVFKAAGYRIGPSEIENCLVKHPAVANAAVVPKPDRERGAVVKAYVVLAPGRTGDDALVAELQQHVKGRLAPYEYPKEIEFIDALPMTTTGKVQRRVLRLREEERARAADGRS
ncbi:MAG TPA: AMP-binding protein [Ramlibacter sp.]|jgi:acetyl-CoA synthetase|uniref:acyl-CoA synthetase n=1 Tax=Ramlibacter sp. TaxID=1917967 RepID=UPI002D42CC4E|nr:AMP-binding protein [Ramlibacter sp.]HZY19074.1 AMP-binding protein [Ramlibacter sp.]